jgi:hypothetical protein
MGVLMMMLCFWCVWLITCVAGECELKQSTSVGAQVPAGSEIGASTPAAPKCCAELTTETTRETEIVSMEHYEREMWYSYDDDTVDDDASALYPSPEPSSSPSSGSSPYPTNADTSTSLPSTIPTELPSLVTTQSPTPSSSRSPCSIPTSTCNPTHLRCNDDFAPVCGCNHVSYSNACYARYYGCVSSWVTGICSSP